MQYIFIYIYIYIYISISIYIYIYLYISKYIYWKKNRIFCILLQKNERFSRFFTIFAKECCILCILLHSLQKNVAFFALFYVLCKRPLRALHSFMFFRKNAKERIVLLGLISRQKAKTRKKNSKNVSCFKRTQKNDAFRT